MDLSQLRSFLAVAECLHFSRAAERVHISQPALSLQIRNLEDELGVRLFARNRRKTEITAAGAVFRDEVSIVLAGLERAAARARQAAAGKIGSLRIGFISTAAAAVVPPLVTAFRRGYPQVELEMRHALTADQIAMLEAGEIDIGFFRLPAAPPRGIVMAVMHREPFRLFLHAGHPLEARAEAGLADLDGQEVLVYARKNAPGFHDLLIQSIRGAGAIPSAIHQANDMNTLMSLVSAGVGIAVAPASVGRPDLPNLVSCALRGMPLSEVVMAYRAEEANPAVRAFVELALAQRADAG
ncbi:LysR family transcriptional regulator [Oleispirillum naphthae]|uniref:LysR family transcriptional regulator n=1 Tax=Oleispirillum naphthae TaxID=2838853 RepID=UPI0030826A45